MQEKNCDVGSCVFKRQLRMTIMQSLIFATREEFPLFDYLSMLACVLFSRNIVF